MGDEKSIHGKTADCGCVVGDGFVLACFDHEGQPQLTDDERKRLTDASVRILEDRRN